MSPILQPDDLRLLQTAANRLRRDCLIATTEAGSGHPTSCLSCAELVAVLFFKFLRFDTNNPESLCNDRFVLSKGHAAPILWAALAMAGAFSEDKLTTLRRIDSDLEGHPTPANRWVDVATGSLGQGLPIGVGMALSARRKKLPSRIYVLLGDGESAEGSVWEALALASHHRLANLTAVFDINGLGQSQPTMYRHDLDSYVAKIEAFGWRTIAIDGHDVQAVAAAYSEAGTTQDRPVAIVARTVKGKGVSIFEAGGEWHGKPASAQELPQALREVGAAEPLSLPIAKPEETGCEDTRQRVVIEPHPLAYKSGDSVATRKAFGNALKRLGGRIPELVVLDGDVQNSTYTQFFAEAYPDRFVECFIAEQAMVGVAVGMQVFHDVPVAATFACFLSRAFDFIRMAAISRADMKLCGSHAGVSIGEDGPSQMGLEDLAMMRAIAGSVVLYPADAVAAERLVEASLQHRGIVYLRTGRPAGPIIYSSDEQFSIGGSKVLRVSKDDQLTIIAAGVTVFEALRAHDELAEMNIRSRVIDLYSIKPLDAGTLRQAARETRAVITVEDHYPEGGIGEAVRAAIGSEECMFRMLAVNGLPRSGKREELLDRFGISSKQIIDAAKSMTKRPPVSADG